MNARLRVGVLASGSGTNLQAILDATKAPDYPAEVVVVIANVGEAKALDRAHAAKIPAKLIEHRSFPSRDAFEAKLVETLKAHQVELVCLAGFMRLVGPTFLRAFPGKVLNIHPALLPAFPGLHAQRQAIARGVKISGCTVHFVDEGTDTGPILLQAAVPVLENDDEAALAARILTQEHKLYPLAIRLFAQGRVRLDGKRVHVTGEPVAEGPALRSVEK
ncbi:MAG: phosphoribosylglycinamide formyltransferase [Myxococcota bacterium]